MNHCLWRERNKLILEEIFEDLFELLRFYNCKCYHFKISLLFLHD